MRLGNNHFKASSLRDLCTSDEINKWSEFKPLNYDTNNQKITIEKTRELNLGLAPQKLNKLLTSCMDYPGEQTEYTPREIIVDEFKEWEYVLKPPYNQPVRYCPYRLDDFRYYVHDSVGNDVWDNTSFTKYYIDQLLLFPNTNKENDNGSFDYYHGFENIGSFNMLYNYDGKLNRLYYESPNEGTYVDGNIHDPKDEEAYLERDEVYVVTGGAIFDISHMKNIKDQQNWRWNVAVYIPKLKRWGLFDAPYNITGGLLYDAVPSISTNLELLRILRESGTTEYTCLPVLVRNRTKSGLTNESEIYSAPSGKPFILSIIDDTWLYGETPSFVSGEDIQVVAYEPHGFHLVLLNDHEYNPNFADGTALAKKHLAIIKRSPVDKESLINSYEYHIELNYEYLKDADGIDGGLLVREIMNNATFTNTVMNSKGTFKIRDNRYK